MAPRGGHGGSILGRQQPPAERDRIWTAPHVALLNTYCQHDGPQAHTCLYDAPREPYPLDVGMEGDVARHEGAIGSSTVLFHWEKSGGNTLGHAVGRWAGAAPVNDCRDRKIKALRAARPGRQSRVVEFQRGCGSAWRTVYPSKAPMHDAHQQTVRNRQVGKVADR